MTSTPTTATLAEHTWRTDDADPLFSAGFVDVDEWRDAPVRHRYVHGGFTGTDTLFSFYFPAPEKYQGRFFQHVTPVAQSENLAPVDTSGYNKITFSVDSGAYFVETNGGGPDASNPLSGMDPTIGAFRVSAAAARFSRQVAQQVYDREHRPFGYLYGGSGGAYRTIGSAENTDGVWDGFVPYVPGSDMSVPNVFSVRMHAQRILRDVLPDIVEAYDVGGDPQKLQLTNEQSAALTEVTRMGFPPRSWFGWKTMGMHAFSVLYPGVMMADPTFADDYWNVPGYLGADPTSSVHRDRVQLDTTITELLTDTRSEGEDRVAGGVDESYLSHGGKVASTLRLADGPTGWILGAQLIVTSGEAAGKVLRLSGVEGDLAHLEPGQDDAVAALSPGDQVLLDNSSFLAAQTYHRHQVPSPQYPVWDQFRDEQGDPLYPQRPMLLGPMFTQGASGILPTGKFAGKMIVVACLLDREAFPWQADWYRARAEDHLGDHAENRFRLWYVDNALHGDDDPQEFPDRSVTYVGALEAALRQLAAWVENDISPTPTSSYTLTDGQVIVPDALEDRGGIQPVATLTVDGVPSTTIHAGASTTIRLEISAPSPGVIVEVRPDFAGTGELGEPTSITPAATITLTEDRAFTEPGTYYLSARYSAQTAGDPASPHARVQNIARAKLTVV